MEARSRLVDQRLADAQQQAAKDKGVADATQRELRDHIADKDISLTQHLQQQHAWRFRQLELLTRVLGDMDGMAEKMAAQKQRLLSSDKESQMLQKQLEHVSQQLSMSNLMERKLRADLADEHLARDKAQAEAQQEEEEDDEEEEEEVLLECIVNMPQHWDGFQHVSLHAL
eukprot:gene3242-3519_t